MIQLDEARVDALAPNVEAMRNGRGLLLKGKLRGLHQDAAGTLLFGECAGSGKEPYRVSCDFARSESPTFRCTCPSRQFPCKHCLGLMYAYAAGKPFTVAEVPADLADKRAKLEARAEKRKQEPAAPRKVNLSALRKKVAAQREALDRLEVLLRDLVRAGLANLNAKSARRVEEQARELEGVELHGARYALHELTQLFHKEGSLDHAELSPSERERVYAPALDKLNRLRALLIKGREALARKLEDEQLAPDTQSEIEAWLGYRWRLDELRAGGLVVAEASLLQLAFHSQDNRAREEFVDSGVWIELRGGRVVRTRTYRPYRALKFVKGEDSTAQVLEVPELCVYPGEGNPRVRWDGARSRPATRFDRETAVGHAVPTVAEAVRAARNQLKSPLADRHPLTLLRYARIGRVGSTFVVEDTAGGRLALADDPASEGPATCHLLPLLPARFLSGGVLLGRFHHDLDQQLLRLEPLSLVSPDEVLRLSY